MTGWYYSLILVLWFLAVTMGRISIYLVYLKYLMSFEICRFSIPFTAIKFSTYSFHLSALGIIWVFSRSRSGTLHWLEFVWKCSYGMKQLSYFSFPIFCFCCSLVLTHGFYLLLCVLSNSSFKRFAVILEELTFFS